MEYYFLIILVAVFFYAAIPGAGAFYVRSRWRRFRSRIIESSLFPPAEYHHLRTGSEGYVGNFRFFGDLEAIQGDDIVWLRDHGNTVSAEVNRVPVYWLPSSSSAEGEGLEERNEETLPDEMPVQVPWHRIFSLPEGTRMFVSGPLYSERGRGVFKSTKEVPLTLVIYDGTKESILRRAIWSGRQRNEYWNPFTPGSLTVGSFGLIIIAYILLRAPLLRLPALLSLAGSLFPLLPLLPPGLLFFFLYRIWWKRARLLRAERDMVQLPLRHFPGFSGKEPELSARLPSGETLHMAKFSDRDAAIAALDGGKIRRATRLKVEPQEFRGYYLFGGGSERVGSLSRPADPMAELVLIPGNPIELSALCSKRARIYEILATAAVSAAVLVNLYVVLVVLGAIVK